MQELLEAFPFFREFETELYQMGPDRPVLKSFPANASLFFEGDDCEAIAFLVSGVVRVFKVAENGREITLYRIHKGESCILTISCIIGQKKFPAMAVVEEEVELLLVGSKLFKDWMNRFESLRNYVFGLLSNRLDKVLTTVDEVAFRRVDKRLAEYLLQKCGEPKKPIEITHQQIAVELGTSREVVSRILKDFEKDGSIGLGRSRVEVLSEKLLQKKIGTL